MEILAIIPARGGSKGIPLKNLKKLEGKTLLEHTITSAKNAKSISKIILSTDDKKIANIGKKRNIEVPFLRPKKISGNKNTNQQVVKHALDFLEKKENYIPDIVILLQPTNPFRTSKMIEESIKILTKTNCDTVISVIKVKMHPYSSFWERKGNLIPFKEDFKKYGRRQSRPILYHPSGEIFACWYKVFKKFNSFYGKKIKPYVIEDDIVRIDIDTEIDFTIAKLIKKNKKLF